MKTKSIIEQTKAWLTTFIIGYNICPFAKREYDRGSIHYSVVESNVLDQCLESVFKACQQLDSDSKIETTLLIFPKNFDQLNDYLDFLNLAEFLLIDQNYEGTYQLASFHPDYCFDGESPDDPANFTNKSPYPMLHLIREASLEHALDSYPYPEKIPERNIKLTRQLGLDKLQAILRKCYDN